jgi:hypothetical protein
MRAAVLILTGALVLLAAVPATAGRTPRCFGAPARDGCANPRLRTMVRPTPEQARALPNAPCATVEPAEPPFPCLFGVAPEDARGSVALVGDSHAAHWRGAIDVVAQRRHWAGVSLTSSGCPLTAAAIDAPADRQAGCARVIDGIVRWLGEHPEITRLFVSDHGSRVVPAEGRTERETQIEGFREAWRRLPRSIADVVVIRDAPWSSARTTACIDRAIRRRQDAGRVCALPRRLALRRDVQVLAARGFAERRVDVVDLTDLMCDAKRCYPVVGGALVHKDLGHLTATFAATMGPAMSRLLASAEGPSLRGP